MLGAERIFMIDHHDYRLEFAQSAYGVVPLNFDEIDDPAGFIVQETGGYGVDASIEAVGFENKGNKLETVMTNMKLEGGSGFALRQCIAATRRGGVVSVPGVYAGPIHAFLYGDIFEKGLTLKGGQTHVQHFMPELLEHIQAGRLKPEAIITHRLPLAQAAEGYKIFDEKQEDCRKVVLVPA
jgi:threonine dehydrogenase-like Zn-dependent dehydrogenase